MESLKFKNGYEIKKISLEQIKSVYELCAKCSDYYVMHDGVKPTSEEAELIFTELPPDKDYKDKFVFGVFNCINELVGIIDVVRNFPREGEWIIGLMIIAPQKRHNGLGSEAHSAIAQWSKKLGAKSLRIVVIEENHVGIKFWTKLGYRKIKQVEMKFKTKKHIVNVMRFNISDIE